MPESAQFITRGLPPTNSPQDDVIRVPAPSTFHSQEDYYHSLYHEMTHASGHSSHLNRDGLTRQARFGSEPYSQEELIAELGAAFLSNEAGILDAVRFENSAAYLGSWINKLENDPKLIVSTASQAQKASDFVLGIEHKESLQECQISPEGMPLTWAREHGIDTRIPGFAHHDQDDDGVSTLIEWKHGTRPTDRLSRPPHRQSLSP
jgi:Zincin-like metallopeptidase